MEISDLAIRIIIVLTPGFLTTLLFRYLSTHKEYTNFYFFVLSAVFGLSNYMILEVFYQLVHAVKISLHIFFGVPEGYIHDGRLFVGLWESLVDRTFVVNSEEIFYSSVIAILSSFLYTYVYQRKILLRFANRVLHITNKSGDDDIWSHYLNSDNVEWVWIRDYNQSLTYFGKIEAFSDSGSKRELFLSDVSVYSLSGRKVLYTLNSVYLSLTDGMYSIEQPFY
ncbi:hypothetical protein [Leptospira brenneri]|uniref:hypothetical protein n=1 Tax=Leptospira brenneri TaxID=2023182 RepID=UPI000C2AC396|nr:hypothetical protein [Leptospira brenneri]PJZ45781.1 hypothetical protein CH361_07260 [Leptospira brenneri]